jgi:hypothetical protein
LLLGTFAAPGLLGQGLAEAPLQFDLGCLQFLDARLQCGLFGTRPLLARLQLVLRCLQILPQLTELNFQL